MLSRALHAARRNAERRPQPGARAPARLLLRALHDARRRRALRDVVVEIHASKEGMFLPGAGHRVVAPEEARRRKVRTVVVANATYVDEVAAQCEAIGLGVDLDRVGDRPFARTTRRPA